MVLYNQFRSALRNHPSFGYLLNSRSLQDAFYHLHSVAGPLGHLKGTRIEEGQLSAYDQWGARLYELESRSKTEDAQPWRFVFDTPIHNKTYIHHPVVQICSGEPYFYRFVMTFKPDGVTIAQDFDCVDVSPDLSKVYSERRQPNAVYDARVTLAERERQDAEYAIQRIAVLGPARVFIHNEKKQREHVDLVQNIQLQLNNFLDFYENPNACVEPQSRYRLTNGGWAGEGEESTGVPKISSFFGLPDPAQRGRQKESVTVMPAFGAYDRVEGVDQDNYYEVSGTWGDDSRYLVGYSTSLVIFEPYGFWTGIELYNGMAQRKPIAIITKKLKAECKTKGYEDVYAPLKDGKIGHYRKYENGAQAALWINRCWNVAFLNKFLQITPTLSDGKAKGLMKLRKHYLADEADSAAINFKPFIHSSLALLNASEQRIFKVALVQHIGAALQHLSPNDQDDFALVFLAIKQDSDTLRFASQALQNNQTLIAFSQMPDSERAVAQNSYIDSHLDVFDSELAPNHHVSAQHVGRTNSVFVPRDEDLEDVEIPENPYKELLLKIACLKQYGLELSTSGRNEAGTHTQKLARDIQEKINALIFKRILAKDAARDINDLLKRGRKTMGQDRKWCDIIAHILLAGAVVGLGCATGIGLAYMGIGLAIVGIPACFYGSFFMNNTKRQMKLYGVGEEAEKVFRSPVSTG